MADKRNATTSGAWVSPVNIESAQAPQRDNTPTFRGATDGLKITVFFALAVTVGVAVAYLVSVFAGVTVAVAVFVLVVLCVFVPLFVFTLLTESGFLHRRIEIGLENSKVDLAILSEMQLNEEQQHAIEAMQHDIALLWEQVESLKTIRIKDKDGVRVVSKHDEIDAAIDSWLAKSIFDAKGQLTGVHPSGVLIEAYPFKGKDERSRQAHERLTAARLVDMRKPSNQYCWIGPPTLTDTRRALGR